jgi:tetratricopeptide (TPR) repeat protein
MSQPPANLIPALDRYRRGDLAGARRAAEAALSEEPGNVELHAFAGLVAAQAGDEAGAIPHFRAVLAALPGDMATRTNLATALVSTGALDEARTVAEAGGKEPRLLRLLAHIHQEQGRADEAARIYRELATEDPGDFESWNNLGNLLSAAGNANGAVAAFSNAIAIRPDIFEMVLNLSEALARADRAEERRTVMREAVRISPDEPRAQAELGLAESSVRDYEAAERAYREAIRLDPGNVSAYLDLGLVLENLNRVADLTALVAQAKASGLASPEIGFIEAWALRRQNRFDEALPLAEATPASINPVRRAQLVAEVNDRVGHTERAFAAFEEMNRLSVEAKPAPPGRSYRAGVRANAALLTAEQVAGWSQVGVVSDPPSPIFIVGFPRSGTTLLDTLLMNVPDFHVLEEQPAMRQVESGLGIDGALASLTTDEANRLRRRYFEVLAELGHAPGPDLTIVDKHPLHMTRMPLIHRIFPDAKILMVERHPCDVVLSCFMSNFQLNDAMRSFTDLEEAARTYDAAFDAWERAASLLPLDVHRVRYERMVEDLETEMRALLAFLGRPFDPAILDNQASAAARGHVRTASYSQVSEPIYTRSSGRWRRYRAQLEPVIPILAPWAHKMGYQL